MIEGQTFTGTKKEFAALLGVDYGVAQGLVGYLVAVGLAKESAEKRKANSETGRGKPSSVFSIPLSVNLTFAQVAKAAA